MTMTIEERSQNARAALQNSPRISVTELARSREWREQLKTCDAIEVVDRGETTGYLVSPRMKKEFVIITYSLDEMLDHVAAQALFDAREGYEDWLEGAELEQAALSYFDECAESIEELLDES